MWMNLYSQGKKTETWSDFILVWTLILQSPLVSSFLPGFMDSEHPAGHWIGTSTKLQITWHLTNKNKTKPYVYQAHRLNLDPLLQK